MRKIIFICSLVCCCFNVYVMNNFEMLLVSQPSYLPESTIGIADIGNRYSIEKKLGMTIAGSIVHYTVGYLFEKPENTPKRCAECITRILSANEPYISKYRRIIEYYESDIAYLEAPQSKYDACKWMLDESSYIVKQYSPKSLLSPIINALEIITEKCQSTAFSELINGGWRKSNEIIRVFKRNK